MLPMRIKVPNQFFFQKQMYNVYLKKIFLDVSKFHSDEVTYSKF